MQQQIETVLHMDGRWMWRFYLVDKAGDLVAMSTTAYFKRAEAERAMRQFRHGHTIH